MKSLLFSSYQKKCELSLLFLFFYNYYYYFYSDPIYQMAGHKTGRLTQLPLFFFCISLDLIRFRVSLGFFMTLFLLSSKDNESINRMRESIERGRKGQKGKKISMNHPTRLKYRYL